MKTASTFIFGIALLVGCSSSQQQESDRIRRVSGTADHYHNEIRLRVGWFPYEEGNVEQQGDSVWSVGFSDTSTVGGMMPVIVIGYPDSERTLTLGMDVDNALLGKLLKHSLMTQVPIERPFTDFFKKADCSMCHPPDVKIPQ